MSLKDSKIGSYVVEAIGEMKKVVWPTRQETMQHTLLVIGISLGVAFFIGAVDYVFNFGIEQLFR
ncbi:preprotein translocase subunit SecE [Candidatus Uhrbacteria bacterium]|nr:preprotein translocase subunit SecE [Candidatus Uhrbacteria bacterium]